MYTEGPYLNVQSNEQLNFQNPKEVIKHHAPLTPRSTQSTGLFKRAVYSKEFQTLRDSDSDTFYRRYLEIRGEGVTANFGVI